jgi:hypothetical protein
MEADLIKLVRSGFKNAKESHLLLVFLGGGSIGI